LRNIADKTEKEITYNKFKNMSVEDQYTAISFVGSNWVHISDFIESAEHLIDTTTSHIKLVIKYNMSKTSTISD
jgi:hypothetical protein